MNIDTDPKGEPQQPRPWNNIVAQKRTTQLNLIPETWRLPAEVLANPPASSIEIIRASGILSTEELAWTETTDICDLVSLIKTRSITSEQLTTAFCKRAAISQQVNKCLTEIFFERALQRARDLDEVLWRTGEVVGPLHGVPVSVKDRFDVEGIDTTVGMFSAIISSYPGFVMLCANLTIGWVGLTNKPAQSNGSVVQLLESMGAVLYVKTNVPQSLMVSFTLSRPSCSRYPFSIH